MDSLEYNGFSTTSDAFIEIEEFECFSELETSFVTYADRLPRSQYTLGTTDNFEHNELLDNEIITVPKNFLRVNSFNKKSESFDLLLYKSHNEMIMPTNESGIGEHFQKEFITEESQQLLFLLSQGQIVSKESSQRYMSFNLKERIYSENKTSENDSFDFKINEINEEKEKVEKIIEKNNQIVTQTTLSNKKINYSFDTTKIEHNVKNQYNSNSTFFESKSDVSKEDLKYLEKDIKSHLSEQLTKRDEKILRESENISKNLIKEEFSKFIR